MTSYQVQLGSFAPVVCELMGEHAQSVLGKSNVVKPSHILVGAHDNEALTSNPDLPPVVNQHDPSHMKVLPLLQTSECPLKDNTSQHACPSNPVCLFI